MASSRVVRLLKVGVVSWICYVCIMYYDYALGYMPRSKPCNPFTKTGWLQVSLDQPRVNKWIPFSNTCPPSDILWPAVMASIEHREPTNPPIFNNYTKEVPEGFDVERLRGKTALMVGDSLGRENIFYFCKLFGENPVGIGLEHPFGVPNPTEDRPVLDIPPSFTKIDPPLGPGGKRDHHSHYCYIPTLDLMLIQVFSFGMDEDFYWRWRENAMPYLIDYRVSYLARGISRKTGRGEPEVVLVGSALWDSARWMREDLKQDINPDTGLSPRRIKWYRKRVSEVLQVSRKSFPHSNLRWLSNHYPAVNASNGWFTEDVEGKKSRPVNKINRLAQMNAAARSVVEEGTAQAEIFMWGELMLGQENYQMDDLHHQMLPGGVLFSEMLLHDLYYS